MDKLMTMGRSVKMFDIVVTMLWLSACGRPPDVTPTPAEKAASNPGPPVTSTTGPTSTSGPLPTLTQTAEPGLMQASLALPGNARAWQLPNSHIHQIAYSPDGEYLAVSASEVLIYRADTMGLWAKNPESKDSLTVAWSRDGQHLATGSSNGTIVIWGMTDKDILASYKMQSMEIRNLEWSPDGQRLAVLLVQPTSGGGDPIILNAMTGEEAVALDQGIDFYSPPSWSPDGKQLAGGMSQHGFVTLWDGATGKQQTKLAEPSAQTWGITWVNAIAWSHDGKWLASGLGSDMPGQSVAVIYDLATGKEQKILSVPTDPKQIHGVKTDVGIYYAPWEVDAIAWSPDGKLLASGSYNGMLRLWNTSTGEAAASLENIGTGKSISWSPDGKTLAIGTYEGILIFWDVSRFVSQ